MAGTNGCVTFGYEKLFPVFIGKPQFGHVRALSEISFPHSGHFISDILDPPSFICEHFLFLNIFYYSFVYTKFEYT